jgi:hypothetical protein
MTKWTKWLPPWNKRPTNKMLLPQWKLMGEIGQMQSNQFFWHPFSRQPNERVYEISILFY